jgi:hypothetical protein
MKKYQLIVLSLMVATGSLAQIKFEPGYFIANDGQRTECEIRNVDWENNPTSFQYRINGGEAQDGVMQGVREFGLTGGSVFSRFTVDMDRSSDIINNLSKERSPEFKSETLYLRRLVVGKAILYEYFESGLRRYFYSMNDGAPTQLVYKRFMQSDPSGRYETGYASSNELYKQQIFNDLKCASISQREVTNLKYERSPLMKIFLKFNECTGTAVAPAEATKRKSEVHLTLRPGLFSNGMYIDNGTTRTELDKALAFRFGAELEMVLPFNKGLWSTTFEPVFQTYSSSSSTGTITVDYKSIDLTVNLRRYLFIKENGSLYLNIGAAYGLPLGGKGAIKIGNSSLDISAGINITAGLGYRMGKVSAEFNYAFGRGVLGNYVIYDSGYGGPGLILGYRLF